MKRRHRIVHKLSWLLLAPLLVLLILVFSDSDKDLTPVNPSIPHLNHAKPLQ